MLNLNVVEKIHVSVRDLNDVRRYDESLALVGSAEQAGLIPKSLADGERGCICLDTSYQPGARFIMSLPL